MYRELPVMQAFHNMKMRPSRLYSVVVGQGVFILAMSLFLISLLEAEAYGIIVGSCLVAQYIFLVIAGSTELNRVLQQDARDGILDFHRLTPMSADSILWGYVLGAPVNAQVAWGIFTLVGLCFTFLDQTISPQSYLLVTGVTIISAIFFHLACGMGALWGFSKSAQQKNSRANMFGALTIICPLMPFDPSFLTPMPVAMKVFGDQNVIQPIFFGYEIAPMTYSFFFITLMITICYVSLRRKIASEAASVVSKPHALFILLSLAILVFGRTYHLLEEKMLAVTVQIITTGCITLLLVVLCLSIVPRRLLLRRHLIRKKENCVNYTWFHDNAPALPFAVTMCLFAFGIELAIFLKVRHHFPDQKIFFPLLHFLTIGGLITFLVASLESARLRLRRNGGLVLGIACAIWWLFPLIAFSGMLKHEVGQALFGISPLAGVVTGFVTRAALPESMQVMQTVSLTLTIFAAVWAIWFRVQSEKSMQGLETNSSATI